MATVGFTMDAEGDAPAVALIISAVATGACCLLIGRCRLANLVRFIPYPVTGGFVAGIGVAALVIGVALFLGDGILEFVPAVRRPCYLASLTEMLQ